MSITGIIYRMMPGCGRSRLALFHFWGHNLGLPAMIAGLSLRLYGVQQVEMEIAIGSTLVAISLAAFAINVYWNGGHQSADSKAPAV